MHFPSTRPRAALALDDVGALRTVAMELGEEMEDAKAESDQFNLQLQSANNLIADLRSELKDVKRNAAAAEKKTLVAEARLAREKAKVRLIQKEKKNKSDLLRYHEAKKQNSKELTAVKRDIQKLEAENCSLREKCTKLTERVGDLDEKLVEKEEEVEKLKEATAEEIVTCPGGSYTPKFRTLIYSLLGKNVPHESISPVIEDCWNFQDKRATTLPTAKTIGRMNLERLALSQKQIGVSIQFLEVTGQLAIHILAFSANFTRFPRLKKKGRSMDGRTDQPTDGKTII